MKDGKVEPRYRVTHKDGEPINPDHRLFILSRDTDPYAALALAFYSQICKATHPQLSEDILRHYDIAPPEPVVLTNLQEMEIALRIAKNTKFRGDGGCELQDRNAVREVLKWLAANGFALVRTTGVK